MDDDWQWMMSHSQRKRSKRIIRMRNLQFRRRVLYMGSDFPLLSTSCVIIKHITMNQSRNHDGAPMPRNLELRHRPEPKKSRLHFLADKAAPRERVLHIIRVAAGFRPAAAATITLLGALWANCHDSKNTRA